jgi:AcrR family transcriptional regulator
MAPNTPTSSLGLPDAARRLDHRAVPPQPDRARLMDIALHLFRWRGYDAITPDQIAATASITPQDFARHFATKDAVIMSLADEISHAGVASLAHVAPNGDPLDALFTVHAETLTAIVNGVGIMTRERLVALAHILTAHQHLREQVRAQRKRVLTIPLAEHTSVAPEDRPMRLAFTTWAAIVTGSYNYFDGVGLFDRAGFGPSGDGRVPEVMVQRLKETFTDVTGREPPRQAIEAALASWEGTV